MLGGVPLGRCRVIHERTKHQSQWPLLQGDDPLGTIRRMLVEREPVYKQADVINTELRLQREVVAGATSV